MRKIIKLSLVLMFLLVMASSVLGGDYTKYLNAYYSLNETTGSSIDIVRGYTGQYNTTEDSVTSKSATGIYGNAWDLDDTNTDGFEIPGGVLSETNWSMVIWFKPETLQTGYLTNWVTGGDIGIYFTSGTDFSCVGNTGNTAPTSTIKANEWQMFVCTYDGTNLRSYNGSHYVGIIAHTAGAVDANDICFGGKSTGCTTHAAGVDGLIDEIMVFNGTLSLTNITDLYNNKRFGLAFNGTNGTSPDTGTTFNVSTIDLYDLTTITNFTATIYNSSYSETRTTTNGSAIFTNATGIYTVNISATNYFNRSYTNVNGSNDFQASIYQAVLNVNSSELISNNKLLIYNTTVGTKYNDTTTGLTTFYLKSGTYTITIDKAGYYNKTKSVTINALTNTTQTVTGLYDTLLNVTATQPSGTAINIFSINITGINYTYSATQSTTNGTVYFSLITGDYNLSFDSPNSTIKYNTTRVNSTGKITSWKYTFIAPVMNSILFNIYDEITKGLISNKTITIELISDLFSNNYTTANGTRYISLLTPENYTIRYSAPSYYTRTYYFSLSNRTINTLNLYLVNTSVATEVTATVLDASNFAVENAYIKVLKYDLATNSYIVREIVKTNFEGEGLAHIVLNDELYKFIIDYKDETKLTTTETQIYESAITFQISLSEAVGSKYYTTAGIDYTLTFNNNTNTFTYTYNDKTNIIGGGCLKIYELTHLGETKLNDTCIESSSGSVAISVTNQTGKKYKAVAYVHFDEYYFIDALYKSYEELFNDEKDLRLFLLIIIQLVIVFVSAWDLVVMFILLPIPATIGYFTGLIAIPLGILITFWFAVVFLAFVISERN